MFTKLLQQSRILRTRNFQSFSIFTFLLFLTLTISAQSSPQVLTEWTALEEAEFLVDTSYQIIKCSPESTPEILLNVFNEAGMKTSFTIVLHFSDASNNQKDVEIIFTNIKQGEMRIASCTNNQYSNLKFNVPEGINVSSLKLTITYK
ncbi:MAG: hypothetical protein JKY44_04445 [Flavobacteriaceae bacterium]|nr:hypothetical protein [Flavobacteriaceae bacterium]